MIDHHRSDLITDYVRKHSKSWYIFANRKLRRGVKFEDLLFVTHCYKTASWSSAVLPSTVSRGFELSLSGGILGAASAEIATSFGKKLYREAPLCRTGPPLPEKGAQLSNDQSVFVQGWTASRWLKVLPIIRIADYLPPLRKARPSIIPTTVSSLRLCVHSGIYKHVSVFSLNEFPLRTFLIIRWKRHHAHLYHCLRHPW